MKPRTAIVLAGGAGARLHPLTQDSPKAMLPVAGKPILQWVIEWLAEEGIDRAIIGVAYQKEKIVDYFKDGSLFGLDLAYSVHTVEGGTAEGFRLAIERYVDDDAFVAMNGDELCDINLESLSEYHDRYKPIASVCVSPLRSPFGVVVIDSDNRIIDFREKAVLESVYVSIGVYMFQKEILKCLPEKGDVERTAFVSLARQGKLRAYLHRGLWVTVNTLKDLQEANRILSNRRKSN